MSNNTKAISFWNFLKKNTIEIPIIQRDYAQGRLGKENLRKTFLADLKKALDKEAPYKDAVMKLDFVYGSAENGKLNPLDGQQRLTTLWLLHWYIALRAGKLNETYTVFKKFTYETRISSREFCQNLCDPENFKNFDGNDIVGFITKQTWFYSAWKQDPTIQSMLRMLGGTKEKKEDIVDGIEELFKCSSECFTDGKVYCVFKRYWEKLTSNNAPVVFYHLPLKDFGLSDDLYIKMNARGKQLTSFENFKADLIGYITKQSEDESLEESEQAKWEELLDPKNGIPIKLDTDWTDIFWKNRSIGITDKESEKRKSDQIDEIYFAFLNRFFWNELFIGKKAENSEVYILDIGKEDESSTQENNNSSYKYLNNSEHNNDATIAYEGLDVYRYDNGTIPLLFFQKIKRVLDNYFAYSKCNNCLPECPWETSFRFIPIYEVKDGNNTEITNNTNDKILSVSTLNQVQRVVFFAVCKYFDHDDKASDSETSLKRWMRVVWNLVSGEDQNGRAEIRSTSALRTAIKFIDSLESHNVYESLSKYDVNTLGDSSFDERCKEEIAKAKQILNGEQRSDGNTWEKTIIEAEKYAFFKGAIRFLFTNEKGEIDWNGFDTKWGNAKKYFDENGVKEKYKTNSVLLRTFISRFKKWGEFWGFNYDNKISTWKYLLTSERYLPICEILSNHVQTENVFISFTASLENCEEGYQQLQENVQNDLVKTNIIADFSSEKNAKLNWRYNKYSLYPTNTKSQKNICIIADKRNTILADWLDKEIIKSNQKINECNFFWGWDINFTYNNSAFLWNKNGFIYLMDYDNHDIYLKRDETKTEELEKYLCFDTSKVSTPKEIEEKMDELISEWEKSPS